MLKGNNVGTEHVGTRGLPDVCEGLLGVCSIPLGSVLVVEVVVVISLPCLLKVPLVDVPLVNKGNTWMKMTSDAVKQNEACQNQSKVWQVRNTNAWVSCSIFGLSVQSA